MGLTCPGNKPVATVARRGMEMRTTRAATPRGRCLQRFALRTFLHGPNEQLEPTDTQAHARKRTQHTPLAETNPTYPAR